MQRADKNIDELLEEFNSAFHRLGQSGIDEELFEIISGFEALSREEMTCVGGGEDLGLREYTPVG